MHRPPGQPGRDDWRTTIGAFANDPVAKEIIDEALRLHRRAAGVPLVIVLDTGHISLLQHPSSAEAQRLVQRLNSSLDQP